jgi:hypothetical protein
LIELLLFTVYCYPQDNGTLITLEMGRYDIGAEQAGDLQRICVASGIELAILDNIYKL